MHGSDWVGRDVSGWWVSEKFNGHRVRWTGSQLVTRAGKTLAPPPWFTNGLPKYELDGELHAGRGKTNDDVQSALKRGQWEKLVFTAFDVPGLVIEEAVKRLKGLACGCSFWKTPDTECARHTARVVRDCGGEGIMLRRPGSAYVPYRTDDLLKMKA